MKVLGLNTWNRAWEEPIVMFKKRIKACGSESECFSSEIYKDTLRVAAVNEWEAVRDNDQVALT